MWIFSLMIVLWPVWFIYRMVKVVKSTPPDKLKQAAKDMVSESKKAMFSEGARGNAGRNIRKFL